MASVTTEKLMDEMVESYIKTICEWAEDQLEDRDLDGNDEAAWEVQQMIGEILGRMDNELGEEIAIRLGYLCPAENFDK